MRSAGLDRGGDLRSRRGRGLSAARDRGRAGGGRRAAVGGRHRRRRGLPRGEPGADARRPVGSSRSPYRPTRRCGGPGAGRGGRCSTAAPIRWPPRRTLLAARQPFYARAHLRVETDGRTPAEARARSSEASASARTPRKDEPRTTRTARERYDHSRRAGAAPLRGADWRLARLRQSSTCWRRRSGPSTTGVALLVDGGLGGARARRRRWWRRSAPGCPASSASTCAPARPARA